MRVHLFGFLYIIRLGPIQVDVFFTSLLTRPHEMLNWQHIIILHYSITSAAPSHCKQAHCFWCTKTFSTGWILIDNMKSEGVKNVTVITSSNFRFHNTQTHTHTHKPEKKKKKTKTTTKKKRWKKHYSVYFIIKLIWRIYMENDTINGIRASVRRIWKCEIISYTVLNETYSKHYSVCNFISWFEQSSDSLWLLLLASLNVLRSSKHTTKAIW